MNTQISTTPLTPSIWSASLRESAHSSPTNHLYGFDAAIVHHIAVRVPANFAQANCVVPVYTHVKIKTIKKWSTCNLAKIMM